MSRATHEGGPVSLFSHHAAKPGDIRERAETTRGKGTAFQVLSGSLADRSLEVAAEVDGFIEPVHTVTAAPQKSSTHMSKAAYLASGCLNQYASAVETYNAGIDRLNERYDQAKAADFYVGMAICTVDGEINDGSEPDDREAAIRQEDGELRTTLRADRTVLLATLDTEAETIATTLRSGPDDDKITLMIVAGYLPESALEVFRGIDYATVNTLRSYFHEARKLFKTPQKMRALYHFMSSAKNLEQVAAMLEKTKGAWARELARLGPFIPATANVSLHTQAMQRIRDAGNLRTLAVGDYNITRARWIDAAKATGKLGKGFAWASVFASTADLTALIVHGNDGKGAVDTTLRATRDVTSLISSGGGLLAASGLISLGPVGAGILIAAGLVSCGIMIYQNWDDITHGLGVAWDKTVDGVSWAYDKSGLDSAVDGVKDFVDDPGGAISDGWHAVTPW